MKKIVFTPNAKQEAFFHAQSRYVAYGGARGGGKSWAMRMKLILLALRYEGISILLLRRTLGELRENHILPMCKLLDGVAVYKESAKDFLFPNGSRIKLGYCDSESDVLQYQGQAYEVIGMEEATHFTYYQYLCLTECNRVSGAMREPFTPRMYFTCNPGGVGNDWVKRLFVDRIYTENERAEDYTFIKSLVYDNAYLMEHDPQYVRALEALPEKRRAGDALRRLERIRGRVLPRVFRADACDSSVCAAERLRAVPRAGLRSGHDRLPLAGGHARQADCRLPRVLPAEPNPVGSGEGHFAAHAGRRKDSLHGGLARSLEPAAGQRQERL